MPQSPFSWRRWWPLVLLGVVPLLALWAWPRHPSRSIGSSYEARLSAAELAGFGPARNGASGLAAVAFDSTRLRGVSWVGGDSITTAELEPCSRPASRG
ncbi:hypothetical protein ACFQT0_21400 [Hymenobacter humi]|uniref:Uncharacterized protein n=1 Tax=Hymenobacter humi TaxID=1411620 RepID=A0ABW2U832_9BACT